MGKACGQRPQAPKVNGQALVCEHRLMLFCTMVEFGMQIIYFALHWLITKSAQSKKAML